MTRQLYSARAMFGFDRPELEDDVVATELPKSDSGGVNELRSLVLHTLEDPDEKDVSMALGADRSKLFAVRPCRGPRTTIGPGVSAPSVKIQSI